MSLKSLLEIMNQKREELVVAFAACENLELNIQVRSDLQRMEIAWSLLCCCLGGVC